jgi:hypothetical protein
MGQAQTNAMRPVWLFSLDSEGFHAAPTTTGSLIAWYRARGAHPGETVFRQVHFRDRAEVELRGEEVLADFAAHCGHAPDAAFPPVAGLSFYTWNAAEFLALAARIRARCPQAVIVAGGPHVQQAADWLAEDPIDVVVLGEGEVTFQELLDTPRTRWGEVPGLAWHDAAGVVRQSARRSRQLRLEELPSPFDVIELCDAAGRPLYDAVSYETSRGCPFKCAFCEWGTGAIGTRMVSFPMERLRRDWERIVRAGIPNIWLADSNFGALRDDLEKARLICELKERHGLPRTFATSWSKKHSPRVQEIVLLLNRHGLLPFYQLALQTLTPRALELCHRENMAANEYEPIARRMAAAGVPISAELIWGLPGDDLASFEANLGRLLATFPDINIFGYTLLPGTEFHARREEYRIETVPVAGYGKAKGEYVVGSLSFPRAEGEEGYFLITAHQLLVSGHVLSCTLRFLALQARGAVGGLLRELADALLAEFAGAFPAVDRRARLEVYEARAAIYLGLLAEPERVFAVIRERMPGWLERHAMTELCSTVERLIDLDAWLCPRHGEEACCEMQADFDAREVLDHLGAMALPPAAAFDGRSRRYRVLSPGGLGVVLQSPDGGRWLQGRIEAPGVGAESVVPERAHSPVLVLNEAVT